MNNINKHITLSELNSKIGEAIATQLESSYWLVAEIVELRENYSGHCYLSLAEKEGDKIVAQNRASIWQQTYRMIKPYFESSTGQALTSGIKVRIKVSASFHNIYGINLTVKDIDPSYTVGELTLKRMQILQLLEADGVAEMNKELELPLVPKRIAIISSPTAAGYGDFMDQLNNNPYAYKFNTRLFPAVMQGDGAEKSIITAMENIFEEIDNFDVVVIIRGGGAAMDLVCFDNYNIAYHLTQFPIPVIVGIGHERDETVLDLIAHSALKTPTAVAAFLIDLFARTETQVDNILERLQSAIRQITLKEKQHIYTIAAGLPAITSRIFTEKKTRLNQVSFSLSKTTERYIFSKEEKLENTTRRLTTLIHDLFLTHNKLIEKAEITADLSDPAHVLKKGYSISLHNGKVLRSSKALKKGDEITTVLQKGRLSSTIN